MTSRAVLKTGVFAGLALCLQITSAQIQRASQQPAPQAGATAGPRGALGGGRGAVDPRVQQRTYLFQDATVHTLVPVAGARRWIEKMKELNMTHQYVETAGGTHESVVTTGMPDIFAFFAKQSK